MARPGFPFLRIVLMCPTLAFSLGNKMFKSRVSEAEPITSLSIVEASGDKVDCGALGSTWSLASPSLMMSPLKVRSGPSLAETGLCVERNPEAMSVITNISFAVVQAEGAGVAKSLLSKAASLSSTNTTTGMVVTKSPAEHCTNLGASWALVEGQVVPVAAPKTIHVCVQSAPRTQARVEELITNIAPYSLSTAWQTPCASSRDSSRCARVKVPAMDVEDMYENPLMLCIERRQQVPGSASQRSSTLAFGELERNVKFPVDMFPQKDFAVGVDSGNRTRQHVFVVGPETSGTRLWSQLMRDAFGLASRDGHDTQWVLNHLAAVFHLSLPWGAYCGSTPEVPNYLDFGGTGESYKYASSATVDIHTSPRAVRFNVQPLDVSRKHQQREDPVKVLLIARDPRASLAGKMQNHCGNDDLGAAEQHEALRVMLEAYRSSDPNVHVICYEEMLEKGESYILDKFDEMGLSPGEIPEIIDANEKYSLDDWDCEGDMLSYGELCPNTELGQAIQSKCTAELTGKR